MDEFLNNIWSENNYPAKTKLLKLAQASNPAVKAKDVENFLNGQISYQLLKESKNLSTKLGHIVAFKINEIWQIDLYDVSRFESSNKKYKYMFAVVDVFSRFAYIIPLKNKDIESTSKALEEILSYNKTAPNLIMSDNDSSFLGSEFQKNAILDNDKKYVRSQLLKVPANSESYDKPNMIQKIKIEKKVKQVLKSNEHTSKPLPAKLIRRSLPRKAKNK